MTFDKNLFSKPVVEEKGGLGESTSRKLFEKLKNGNFADNDMPCIENPCTLD